MTSCKEAIKDIEVEGAVATEMEEVRLCPISNMKPLITKMDNSLSTLKKCKPGDEGGVSLEGTAAGVVGSIVLSCFGVAVGLVSKAMLLPLLLAAFVATNIESLIGAVFQDNFKLLTNEVVNGIMTVVGAVVGMALGLALGMA